jgi:hypothetical protein
VRFHEIAHLHPTRNCFEAMGSQRVRGVPQSAEPNAGSGAPIPSRSLYGSRVCARKRYGAALRASGMTTRILQGRESAEECSQVGRWGQRRRANFGPKGHEYAGASALSLRQALLVRLSPYRQAERAKLCLIPPPSHDTFST